MQEEFNESLEHIQKEMLELQVLFRQMHLLIEEQAPNLNIISENIQESKQETDQALEEIEITYEKKRWCTLF